MNTSRLFTIGLVSFTVLLPRAFAQNYFSLEPLTTFGSRGDGSIQPNDQTWVTTTTAQRGLSYNPATGNLIFVDRAVNGGSANFSGAIYVIGSIFGNVDSTLSPTGIQGGTFAHFAAAVAEDGLIYVGNVVADGTTAQFKLYRWFGDFNGGDPIVVYSGDPGNGFAQRWGDTMDIRGQGASTQIILGSRAVGTTNGLRVAILTTADGNTFNATTLTLDATDNATSGGIAFGAGDTFWAKNLDAPLRQFSFNLGTGQATTLRSYGTDVLAASRTLEALAVDTGNNLLALLNTPSGPDSVRLYDISNPSRAPSLLDIHDFTPNNANATTTKGYVDFGNGNLYIHDINNGLLALAISSSTLTAPILASQPVGQRLLAGKTLRLEVIAYPSANYQWQRNGANIPGATNAVFNVTSAQTSDAGTYRVIVSNSAGSTTSDEANVSVINPVDLFHLEPIWSAAPGSQPYINNAPQASIPNQRTIAYSALSNELYIVSRNGNASGAASIFVINATNVSATAPPVIKMLNTNGLPATPNLNNTNLPLVGISVAADGAIYICNMAPNARASAAHPFRVFRWANSDTNTLPVKIWEGDPADQASSIRWGDTLTARGSGLNTQILLDNHNPATARYVAILRPVDETFSSFTSHYFFQDILEPSFGTTIGRSLEFGAGDTFWQKRRGAALIHSSFDLTSPSPGISPRIATYTNLPTTLCGVGVDLSKNLLAGVNIPGTAAPDTLDLYEISDLNSPLLLAQYNFPVNPHNGNANFIGQTFFAGNYVFTIDANNGIMALKVVSGPVSPPTILRQPEDLTLVSGDNGSLSVITADIATFQWQFNDANISGATSSVYQISNAQLSHAGDYRVIVSNDAGSRTSLVAVVTILPAENFHQLATLWSAAPMSPMFPYVTTNASASTPNERNIAYNALSNQLYVVQKSGSSYFVHVVNPDNGAPLYTLNTDGIVLGTPAFGGATGIDLDAIDVADDGAIYASNMTGDGCGCANPSGVFRVYRWNDSDPATAPVHIFQGDPASQLISLRWGDAMDVRGSGLATEVLVDNLQGTFAAVLKPTDETFSTFTSSWFSHSYGAASIGRTLEFATGTQWWQKRKGTRLQLSNYDLLNQTSSVVTNYENWPSTLGPVAVDTARNLVIGIEFSATPTAPDTVNLYDISDFNAPLLIRKYPFPENQRGNANFIGRVLIAGNRVFAINGNNGLVAFTIVPPGGARPILTIMRSGSDVMLSWPASANDYVLQGTPSLSNPTWASVGTPTPSGNQLTVTDNASSGNKFYRLCRGCP